MSMKAWWVGAMILTVSIAGPDARGQGFARGKRLSDAERSECLTMNGKVAQDAMFGPEKCFLPLPDAFKPCTDKAQCIGACIADSRNGRSPPVSRQEGSGVCQPTTMQPNCTWVVEKGRFRSLICAD